MKRKSRGLPLLAIFLCAFISTSAAAEKPLLKIVDRALPVFNLAGLDDVRWQAESLQGKPWLINFWASWCPPCIAEMPDLNKAWEKLAPNNVGMLAINIGDDPEAIKAFLQKIPIDFPVLVGDTRGTLENWSVRGLPTTIVIDSRGKVVFEALGPRDWQDEEFIAQMLNLR